MKSLFVSAAVLALVGAPLAAQTVSPAAIPAAPKVDVPLMKQVVKRLAADDFEGRAPSTAVEPKVLDYIISQFKAVGLKPAGEKGGWLQTVPTVEIKGSNHSPLTITGGAQPLRFTWGDDFTITSFRVTPHTELKDAPLVFVGYGINAPELGWNDYAGQDMHGKIAVILINDPDYANPTEEGLFKGRRMTYYGRWVYKYEEAARQGAAGALIIHDTFPAAYGWDVVRSSWAGAQYRVAKANDDMDQTVANGWVQQAVAKQIFAAAGKDYAALVAAAGHKGFAAVPLGVSGSLSFDNAIRRSVSHNVVGVLPGKAAPQEYVLYSAHWDHLGRCGVSVEGRPGDDICNGAVDNATGVAALTALAEANHKAAPARRSQLFVALTLEESGLLGSEYYAQHPIVPLSKTVGGVNMDALPTMGRARDYAMTGGDKSDLTAIFRAALKKDGLYESPEDHAERGHYYRSDHFSLAKRGVPMFDLSRGVDLFVGGKAAGQRASEDYVEHRYHQPSDEYSESWQWDGIAEDVGLFYQLGRYLATSTAWPNWHQGDEFRAPRDASLKAGN